jgi:flagellar motor switch protein FliG
MTPRTQENITGAQKAAIFMVLVGDKAASNVYRHLSSEQVEELTREIARVDYVSQELALQILDEFRKLSLSHQHVAKGGTDYAQKLLVNAFGEASAKDLIQQAQRTEPISSQDLDLVQQTDPEQLVKLVQEENPQTIALLLAHLGAKTASALLKLFPEDLAARVVERLAKLRRSSPETVQKIVAVLHRKIQNLGKKKQDRLACGGVETVAELLNRMKAPLSKTILETIERQDANLAVAIRDQMFTFDHFLMVPEASIREVLTQIDKKVLAMALKGAAPEVKAHFLKVMSSRAAEMLNEDIEVLGSVRARDLTQAQHDVVEAARKLEAEGKIVLRNEPEENDA